MKSKYPILFSFSLAALVCSGALPVPAAFGRDDEKPRIVREAERRERERQNTQWTPENIRANPALFLQDMIAASDALKNKIEAQDIAIARYTKFLNEAKKQYKAAKENGNAFPVNVNGFELSEEELSEKVADALERIELSKKSRATNSVVVKKVEIRQGVLKTKSRELRSIRRKLVLQLEQVKMNEALGEIDSFTEVLGVLKDMSLEISEDPAKLSLDDITEEDPDKARKQSAEDFLES